MSYRFRFYGRSPGDWHNGANDGHLYEVQFRDTPTEVQRTALAERFERFFAAGPANAATTPWLWSERFARFAIGERWNVSARMAFKKVADFLLSAHRIAPIADVVFWGMREPGHSRWDQWSVATQPEPTAGPAYPGGGCIRPLDAALPTASEDEAFESARAQTRASLAQTRVASATADSGIDVLAIDGSSVTVPEISARAINAVDQPDPRFVDDKDTPADGLHVLMDEPRIIARRALNNAYVGLAYLDDSGAVRTIEFPEGVSPTALVDVHEDADRAVVIADSDLYEVDFGTGLATHRFSSEDGAQMVAYLDGDLWLLRTRKGFLVLDPSEERPAVVAKAARKSLAWFSMARDRTIIITREGRNMNAIYGYAAGKLKKLTNLPLPVRKVWDEDGHVIIESPQEAETLCYRLHGIDETYEAWAAPLREKAEKKRARALAKRAKQAKQAKPSDTKAGKNPGKKKATKLTLEATSAMPPPVAAAPPDPAVKEALGAAYIEMAAGSALGLVAGEQTKHRTAYHIVCKTPDGPLVTFDDEAITAAGGNSWKLGRFRLSADGTTGMVSCNASEPSLLFVDLSEGTLSKYESPDSTYGKLERAVAVSNDTWVMQFEPAGWQKDSKGRRIEVASFARKQWRCTAQTTVTKSRTMIVHDRIVAVLSDAAQRLVVFGVDSTGDLNKLGQFKERIREARFDADGRLFVSTPEEDVFEVVGLADVAEKKAAAAARKRAKK